MYTDDHRKQFLKLLEKNFGNVTKTCRQMNIKGSHETINAWKKKHPWFGQAVRECMHSIFDDIEQNVFELALKQNCLFNPQALTARKFLLTYHPEGRKRGYRARGELTGEDGGPMEIRSFVELVTAVEQREQSGRYHRLPSEEEEGSDS